MSRGVSPLRNQSFEAITLNPTAGDATGVRRSASRSRIPGWLIVALATIVFAPGPIFSYSLYLQDKTQVPAGPVRLGDIARVEGERESGAISGKLLFSDLRGPRYIGAAALRESLGKNGPEHLERIYGSGTWIIPLGRELNAADLEAMLQRQVQALPGGRELYANATLRLAENTRLKVPATGVELVFRLPARGASLTPGKRIIPLDVLPAKNESRGRTVFARHQIQVAILKKQQVAVAVRDLPVGHRLSAADYRMEIQELDNDEIRFATGDLSGRRVMSSVQSGDAFTTSNIQLMPAVRRGQSLNLVYQRPGLVFRVRSIALSAGEIGESIPVRVLFPAGKGKRNQAERRLKARIVNETTVVFESAGAATTELQTKTTKPTQPESATRSGIAGRQHVSQN